MRAIAARQFRARGTSAAALTPLSVLTGVALWLALFESGIDPVVSGLLIGLLTNAYEPAAARGNAAAAISPNERLLGRLRPLTGMVVVPSSRWPTRACTSTGICSRRPRRRRSPGASSSPSRPGSRWASCSPRARRWAGTASCA
jgi:hypothetical protein